MGTGKSKAPLAYFCFILVAIDFSTCTAFLFLSPGKRFCQHLQFCDVYVHHHHGRLLFQKSCMVLL